jgi:hypothetical protein
VLPSRSRTASSESTAGTTTSTARGPDFSNCFVGVYANGSRVRLSDIYAEICQIGIYLGPLCRDVHIVGKGSFANTVQDLVNLGYRTVWEDRREGRIGYARSRPAVPLPANSNSPQIDGLYAFFTQNSVATSLVGFQADPGNPQISDDGFSTDPPGGVLNGVECLLLVTDSNTTIKDASGNATGTAGSMTAGTLAGNARLTDLNGPFSASDVGKWIQVPGAGRGGGPLTAFIRTFTNATSVVLSNTASVSVSGATYTYGSAFKLAGGRDYKPASGEVLRFFAFQGQFVQIGQAYGQVVLPVETLTDAATVTPNWANSGGKLLTLSQATTIANPTGTPGAVPALHAADQEHVQQGAYLGQPVSLRHHDHPADRHHRRRQDRLQEDRPVPDYRFTGTHADQLASGRQSSPETRCPRPPSTTTTRCSPRGCSSRSLPKKKERQASSPAPGVTVTRQDTPPPRSAGHRHRQAVPRRARPTAARSTGRSRSRRSPSSSPPTAAGRPARPSTTRLTCSSTRAAPG